MEISSVPLMARTNKDEMGNAREKWREVIWKWPEPDSNSGRPQKCASITNKRAHALPAQPHLLLRDTSEFTSESNHSQTTQNFLRNVKAHRLTVCQKQLSGNTCGNAVYTIMAGRLDFGLAHFGISPAPQTEEIGTSSTGGQHLLCREMQMETVSCLRESIVGV